MKPRRSLARSRKSRRAARKVVPRARQRSPELVIITGMSGSGKASVLKAFEDLGYYCVDNLPVQLIPQFADLAVQSSEIRRTALVVDVREGSKLEQLAGNLEIRPAHDSDQGRLSGSLRLGAAAPFQRDPPPASSGHRLSGEIGAQSRTPSPERHSRGSPILSSTLRSSTFTNCALTSPSAFRNSPRKKASWSPA